MPITGARNWINAPDVPVQMGGFLRAATVVDVTDPHDLLGGEYLTDACATGDVWEEMCTTFPCPELADKKSFDDGPELVEGDPFTLYAGTSCTLSRLDEALARVRRRFNYAERHLLDQRMCEWLDAQAVSLGSGDIVEAIGLAEGFAAIGYGGVPTIVVPVTLVPQMCDRGLLGESLDGSLRTCQGSLVVNAACSSNSIFVAGHITLLRGAVQSYAAPQQPMCDGTTQVGRALAERTYVPLVECFVAEVEVTTP